MADIEPPLQEEVIKEESLIMPSLPEDIIIDILLFLPVQSILRFRCVCKNWCNKLFKDPKFVKAHLSRSIENNKYNSIIKIHNHSMISVINLWSPSAHNNESAVEIDRAVSLVDFDHRAYGSCNGLILVDNAWELYDYGLILLNPSTKEIKEIPKPVSIDFDETFDFGRYTGILLCTQFGFGYSLILDDYKIVRTQVHYKDDDWVSCGSEVKVYSLRSNSWKRIPYIIPYDFFLAGKAINPVMCNGALHWIGSSCVSLNQGRESSIASSVVVISFDMEYDTLKEVPLTLGLQESLSYDHRTICGLQQSEDIFLGTFYGCLSLVQGGKLHSQGNNNVDISVWVMKEYGVKQSWTKMFSVSTQSLERCVKYSTMTVMDATNGTILFLKDNNSLVLYDPKHETARVVKTSTGPSLEGCSYVDTYIESLVSLNSRIYSRA